MPPILKIEKKKKALKKTCRDRKAGYYRISDLVFDFKVTPRTIRFFEGMGILDPLREDGHRYYDQKQYDRMLIALNAQFLGLRLQDIGKIFAMNDDVTLREIVNLLSSHQLLAQRDELVRQKYHMEAVLSEICSVLRDREQALAIEEKARDGDSFVAAQDPIDLPRGA